MKIDELIKKPIEVVIENNISDDMIFPESTVTEIIKITRSKLKDNVFLLIYVDSKEEKQVKSIITASNLIDFVNLIVAPDTKDTAGELELEKHFPFNNNFIVKNDDKIQSVLNIFDREKTDVVVVISEKNSYLGKITRSKLKEWFDIMGNN